MSATATKVTQINIQSRAVVLLEIAVAYSLLEGALWSRGLSQLAWALAMLLWVAGCTWRAGRSSVQLGIGREGFRRTLWMIPAVAAVCLAMIVAAWIGGSLHGLWGARAPLWHALLYATWAFIQEFLTMSFILVRFEDAFGSRMAVAATAILFCVAHVPNLLLMAATLLMSFAFCTMFVRRRNIYPLAVAHAMLGLTLSVSLPSNITHYMRVGISYL